MPLHVPVSVIVIEEIVDRSLREELDLHSSFNWNRFLREGVDAHFNARVGSGAPLIEKLALASTYWVQPSNTVNIDGALTCPADLTVVAIYSKNTWKYGVVSFRTKLPTLTKDNQEVWLGFENDAATGSGIASFTLIRLAGTTYFRATCGGAFSPRSVVITAALPADYLTARHAYTVRVTRRGAEFYIDNSLVAVGVVSPNLAFTNIDYPPYAILRVDRVFTPKITSLLEVRGEDEELILPLAPSQTRINDGDSVPPRVYRLYDAGTTDLFAGLTIAAGSETSHPVPLFGYATKTLYFRADQAGTLLIEVLEQTDNWRTYASPAVVANTLLVYTIAGEAVLARVTFTPGAYPAIVQEAEMVLR